VAISAGVILAIDPKIVIFPALIFIIVVSLTRFISLGSILGSIAIPITVLIFYKTNNYYLLSFCIVVCIYVVYKHLDNIKRLIQGKKENGVKK